MAFAEENGFSISEISHKWGSFMEKYEKNQDYNKNKEQRNHPRKIKIMQIGEQQEEKNLHQLKKGKSTDLLKQMDGGLKNKELPTWLVN